MLRKTNINRASIKRATDSLSETATEETLNQKHKKNYSINEDYNLTSRSITYNNIRTPQHIHCPSSCSRSDSASPWHKKENWNRNDPRSSRNGSELQKTYNSIKSWNGAEKSSDSKKNGIENEQHIRSATVESLNRKEHHSKASSQKPWNENKLDPSEFMKSQNIYEEQGRLDSNRPLLKNEQHSSKHGANFKKSLNKYEHTSHRECRSQWEDKTKVITKVDLVPGLIIQGQVTEL